MMKLNLSCIHDVMGIKMAQKLWKWPTNNWFNSFLTLSGRLGTNVRITQSSRIQPNMTEIKVNVMAFCCTHTFAA